MLARLRRLMHRDENDITDRRGPSDDPARIPSSNSKLREKLQKLAECRIDPSSIEFEDDSPAFHGGFATVSQAFLVSTPATGDRADNDAARVGRKNKSHDRSTTRKPVAVKKLKIENGKDKERVLGLALREAGFLTEFSHGNVIKLEGFVEDLTENKVWLVFPWAANGSLKDFVAVEEWEIPERVSLINDVTEGVEYLHSCDPPIYHGDLKSANVLVNSNCRAVITDFGSARRLRKKDPSVQSENSKKGAQTAELLLETEFCEATNTMTLTGNQFTLRWAPPELLMDDEPGLWSDIWSLGWIFYQVMTNSTPFQNVQRDAVVVIRVIRGDLPSVAEDPMIVPDRQWTANKSVQRTRSSELLIEMGNMYGAQNDYINASKVLTEALSICTDTADEARRADVLFGLAEVNRGQNNYNKAAELYSEALQIYGNIGNSRGRANALWGLADVHRLQDNYSEAVIFYSEVVKICTATGYKNLKAIAFCGLAAVHQHQEEYSKAVPLYSEAVQICTDLGDKQGKSDALWGLAEVHRLQKKYNQAVELLSEALQISTDIGYKYNRAWALMRLAEVYHDQDQHQDAIRLYEQAAGIFEVMGNTRDVADALDRAAEARKQLKSAEAE